MGNALDPYDIKWKAVSFMSLKDCHLSKFINEEYGIEMEKITPKSDGEGFRKAKTYFFITGQEKEYTDLQELCNDWNEIKNFDDPKNEIIWVKKIVPIVKLKKEE